MNNHFKRKRNLVNGQSLIEFAVAVPVFLLLLMGVLDLGRIFFVYLAMYNAAQEGALYACTTPRCIYKDDEIGCQDPNNAVYRARQESETGPVQWDEVELTFTPIPDPIEQGGYIQAGLIHNFEMVTPLMQIIIPNLTLMSRAECKVIGPP